MASADRASSVLESLRRSYGRYGWRGLNFTLLARILPFRVPVRVKARGIRHPLLLRTRTTDDFMFHEVFQLRTYQIRMTPNPKVIVDCGANLGFASIFYAHRFRKCRIYSVEADAGNFAICARNVRPYRRITAIHAAVWCREENLTVYEPEIERSGGWALRVGREPPRQARRVLGQVRGRRLEHLMQELGIDFIDLLKVDIEGAELELFTDAAGWIDRVGVIVVEVHEHFRPGCTGAVLRAAAGFEMVFRRGNLMYLARPGYRLRRREARAA